MAYDEELAARVREVLAVEHAVTERRMFGGIAFMVAGNMACGIVGEKLMVRVGKEAQAAALAEPHTAEMDFTGQPMGSMVYVTPEGLAEDQGVANWVRRGVGYARSLPAK